MGWDNSDNISGHHLSGSNKMVPSVATGSANYTRATAPAANTEVDRASYVIINVGHDTKYEFKYETNGTWIDYGIIEASSNAGAGPVVLNINPIAWKGGGATAGDVTFVYGGIH